MHTEDDSFNLHREEIENLLDTTSSMLHGMALDPAIPAHAKSAIRVRAAEIDNLIEKITA